MEKIDQILESLYDRVIEPVEAKDELIKIIRKMQTGASDKKLMLIETRKQAQIQVEGIINDYENCIIDKSETLNLLGEYTNRIMEIFWNNAKLKANQVVESIIQWTLENRFTVESVDGNTFTALDYDELKEKFEEWLQKEKEQNATI